MSQKKSSSSPSGNRTEFCKACHAGRTSTFNWQYALEKGNGLDVPNDINIYSKPTELKSGSLFQCKTCKEHWYLDAEDDFMSHTHASKIALIKDWSAEYISLSKEQTRIIENIGSTPSLPNGTNFVFDQTPCRIKTKTGEIFDFAMVTVQSHAPFEAGREYKLASEIEELTPSPYALPLKVRVATAHAVDIRMSYAPTTISLSNNTSVVVNWTQNFLNIEGVDASKSVVHKFTGKTSSDFITESLRDRYTPTYRLEEKITYFIADAKYKSWLASLFSKN